MTIYLWSGTPCAYLDDENIYSFNGKHLRWFRDGFVYDHGGRVVAAIAENFREAVKAAPVKGPKEITSAGGSERTQAAEATLCEGLVRNSDGGVLPSRRSMSYDRVA